RHNRRRHGPRVTALAHLGEHSDRDWRDRAQPDGHVARQSPLAANNARVDDGRLVRQSRDRRFSFLPHPPPFVHPPPHRPSLSRARRSPPRPRRPHRLAPPKTQPPWGRAGRLRGGGVGERRGGGGGAAFFFFPPPPPRRSRRSCLCLTPPAAPRAG